MYRKVVWTVLIGCLFLVGFNSVSYAQTIQEEIKEDEEQGQDPVEFEVNCNAPDGENGFYKTIPQITIESKDEQYKVKYRLEQEETVLAEGEAVSTEKTTIEEKYFKEGSQKLTVWMEDEEGEVLPALKKEFVYIIDSIKPVVKVSAPRGFAGWYTEAVPIQANIEDSGSQGGEIKCYVNGKLQKEGEKEIACTIKEESKEGKGVDIRIEAKDIAGNVSIIEKTLYIDLKAPVLTLEGAADLETNKGQKQIICRIQEENTLQEKQVRIIRENEQGEQNIVEPGEWKNDGETQVLVHTVEEDGIYKIELNAADASGRTSGRKIQFIIDNQKPVITFPEEVSGRVLREFSWEYHPDEVIRDFTSCAYVVKIDGRNYTSKEPVTREGSHMLRVWAQDAAGNESEKTACFLIDRTPPEIIIDGAADDERYADNVELCIRLKEKEDWIEQIMINGETQKITMAVQAYVFTCEREGNYQIEVKARDVAGNEIVREMTFCIEKPKTVLGQITAPFKKILGKKELKADKSEKSKGGFRSVRRPEIIGIIILLLLGSAGAGMHTYFSHKREDAG